MFEKIRIAFSLFWISFKVGLMNPHKRELYLWMLRNNIDLNETLTKEHKEVLHKFIDKIEESTKERL